MLMLHEAFGEHSLSWTAVFEWHSRFKASWVSIEDEERSGRPSTSKTTENVEKIWELIHENRRRTIHELSDTIEISCGGCQEILTENLNLCCIATKFIPQLLTNNQKQQRINMCLELREKAEEDPTFISRIIMSDESWIYLYSYDPETKQQSLQWKNPQSPRPKRHSRSRVQQRACSFVFFFFFMKVIVHHEFVPPNTMFNSDFYCDVLRCLR
jgi:hypothetical protein